MNKFELLKIAEKEYKGIKTSKGKVIGEVRWNRDLTKIVCDTINIYDLKTDRWVEKISGEK